MRPDPARDRSDNVRANLRRLWPDQVHATDPVRFAPRVGNKLQRPNDDHPIQGFAGSTIGPVHDVTQVAISRFTPGIYQPLSQGLFHHLQPQMLGKLLLAQGNTCIARGQPGFEQRLKVRANIQLPGELAHIVGAQCSRQWAVTLGTHEDSARVEPVKTV